jgi:hypothetical protein
VAKWLAEEKQRQKQIPFGDDNKKIRQKKNKAKASAKAKADPPPAAKDDN